MAEPLTAGRTMAAERAAEAGMLLADAVSAGRDFFGDRPAMVGASGSRNYSELAHRISSLATVLAEAGVGAGNRLALLCPDEPRFVEVLLAASRIGAVVVPLNHRLVGAEVAFQVEDADAALAVVSPSFTALAESGGLLARPHLILDEEFEARVTGAQGYAGPRPAPDAVLLQLYTSGTTGRPKGCLLTQANWIAAATSFAHAYDVHADDVVLTGLPLFHVASLSWVFSALLTGATVVVPGRFEPGAFWATVAREGVTVAAVPFGVREALRHDAAGEAGRGLRMMVGAPSRSAADVLPHVEMVSGYGATELCGQVTAIRGDDHRRRPGSIGRLMAGYTASIVDDEGRAVPPGATGELLVRGAALSAGYWQLPGATEELLRDGWLHTGDLVRADADGFLWFVDRLKDMIKTGGENVYSAEVEAVLLAHPQVREVAIFGVPDERWGQAVKAVVVAAAPVEPSALDAWCRERLAPYKRPRWYETSATLPRNASGKVLKARLRDEHDPATAERPAETTPPSG